MPSAFAPSPVALEPRPAVGLAPTAPFGSFAGAAPTVNRGDGRRMLGWLEDAGLLLLAVFALPLAILAVGTPLALAVRLLIEIGRRW